MRACYVTQREARAFVDTFHRHHKAPRGDIYRIGLTVNDALVGVIMVGRPVSRGLDYRETVEVLRLCVLPGHKNACSFLMARAARIAREMGFKSIITYILESETGHSLGASGWSVDGTVRGRGWSCQTRLRLDEHPTCNKVRYRKALC